MKGWHKESYRHYLASKGIKTNKYFGKKKQLFIPEPFGLSRELQPKDKFYTDEELTANYMNSIKPGLKTMDVGELTDRLVKVNKMDPDFALKVAKKMKEIPGKGLEGDKLTIHSKKKKEASLKELKEDSYDPDDEYDLSMDESDYYAKKKYFAVKPLEFNGDSSSLRRIPNLSDSKIPSNWKLVKEHFVSKMPGGDGGPAMSFDDFAEEAKKGKHYAIVREGQFQVYVGEFEKK